MTDPPARLDYPDGWVVLSPAGVRLWAAALALATHQSARRGDGAVTPTDDVAYLREVLCLALERATGSAPGTSGEPVTILMPPPGAEVTAVEAAAIWGVSPRAIGKGIVAGRVQARKLGGRWLLPEVAVREAAVRRRRGRLRRIPDDHGGCPPGDDPS